MISDETKQIIDALSVEELILEINKERRSRFQGDGYAYLETRRDALNEYQHAKDRNLDIEHKEEDLALARSANEISSRANFWSKCAIIVSVISVLISMAAPSIGAWSSFPKLFTTKVNADWQPLVRGPIGLSIDLVATSDLPEPKIIKASGEAKFVDEDLASKNSVRFGYKIIINAAPLDLSKVPSKYLKEKPIDIGGTTITQLPIAQTTHEIRFHFILKDKDGFKLIEFDSEPENMESGKVNTFQRLLSEPVPSAVARRTSDIVFTTGIEKCVTCEGP